MTTRRLIPLAILIAAFAHAQATRPSATSLIDSLRAGDWQARQRAEDALVQLGGDALAAIDAALAAEQTDFESRERLQSARTRIEQERLLLATRVTVQREFDSPLAAFTFLAEQAGVSVDIPASADERARSGGPIRLDLTDTPWLAAIDDLTARTGVATESSPTQLRLLPQAPESLRPPTDYAGSAAVTATGARRRETFQLGDDSRRGDVYVILAVELEPKATLLEPTARLFIHKITDDAGNTVRTDQVVSLSRRNANAYIANLTLGAPGKLPARIASIQGELQGELITRIEQVRITDLETLPRSIDLPDGTIELSGIQTDDKGSKLVVGIPAAIANLPNGQMLARGQFDGLQVLDQHGTPMQLGRTGATHNNGMIEYRYTLTGSDPTDTPTSISWTVPTQTRDIRLPFKLENLPLPE